MPTVLFIVSRRQPDLFEYLSRQFAAEADMKVMLDRRLRERRQGASPHPPRPERRQVDRRRNSQAAHQMLTMGCALARLGAGVS
jgi:hypothetical protein